MKLKIKDVVDAALFTYELGARLVRLARDELSGETPMPLSHQDAERQSEAARRAGPQRQPQPTAGVSRDTLLVKHACGELGSDEDDPSSLAKTSDDRQRQPQPTAGVSRDTLLVKRAGSDEDDPSGLGETSNDRQRQPQPTAGVPSGGRKG